MSKTVPLLNRFELGMRQDLARNQMPVGSVWNFVDWIPRVLDAPARKRGGWTWGSPLTGGGATHVTNVFYAPFRSGSVLIKLLAGLAVNNWFSVSSDAVETNISGSYGSSNPFWFHRDKAIVGAYGQQPVYWPGTGTILLINTAPKATYGVTYKDRSVMANGQIGAIDLPQRVWFSNAGDPLNWDTTNSFIDASFQVRGLASLRDMILVFGDSQTERIIGATPPTATDVGDMSRGVAFNLGCLDVRSIVSYGEMVLFANGQGVWRTDGSVPENLIRGGGLRRYWIDLLSTWQPGWMISAGVLGDNYVVSLSDQNRVFKDCLMLDLQTLAWWRLSNVNAAMFTSATGAAEELYFASRESPRLGRLAPVFRPSAAIGADANGAAVLPLLETPYIEGGGGYKRWLDLYANYVLDGSGVGTSPSFNVGVITEPEDITYTSIGALPGQPSLRRDTLPIRYDSPGVALKIQQQLASSDSRLYDIEAGVYSLEPSRVR